MLVCLNRRWGSEWYSRSRKRKSKYMSIIYFSPSPSFFSLSPETDFHYLTSFPSDPTLIIFLLHPPTSLLPSFPSNIHGVLSSLLSFIPLSVNSFFPSSFIPSYFLYNHPAPLYLPPSLLFCHHLRPILFPLLKSLLLFFFVRAFSHPPSYFLSYVFVHPPSSTLSPSPFLPPCL